MPANRAMLRSNALNGFAGVRIGVIGISRAFFPLLASVSAAPLTSFGGHPDHDDPEAVGTPLWILYLASAILVLLGGAFAGLTIALMGQDNIYLQVLSDDPNEPQSKNAKRVYSLLKRGKHWVLVTLLLGNVIVNESLPVVLDRSLGGGVAAVIGSTVLIVIFGEILPQSVCVRYGLQIGGYMAQPVLILMWLMAPIAWPTAKLLDWALGEDHGTVYKKSGLKTLVTLHKSLGEVSDRLNEDEVTIISAVLDLKEKPVETVMTPMDDVFVMSEDTVLDEQTMDRILSEGYSRIPIHAPGNRSNFVGMLLVKILITYDPEDCMKVKDFPLATLPETRPETSCLDIVNFFQQGKSHMVLVSDYPGEDHGALGVVTLEDVIEELIGEEIIDESDVYIDVHKAIRRLTPAPKARLARREPSSYRIADKAVEESNTLDFRDVVLHLPRRWGSTSAHSDAPGLSSSPKTATFMMRRGSVGPGGRLAGAIPVKANLDEMRDHLKHLGPSNPATNPKNTKSTTVKIKGLATGGQPGTIVAVRPASAAGDGDDEAEDDAGDETTPFIRPKFTGKNGVHALRRSYGGTGMSDVPARLADQTVIVDVDTAEREDDKKNGKEPETAGSGPPTPSHRNELGALNSHRSSYESLGSLTKSVGANTPRRRPYVRSGSITENIFETGGVQKIVIQTASSEEEEADKARSGKPSPRGSSPSGAAPVAQSKALSAEETHDSDTEERDNEPLSPDQPDGPSASNLASTGNGSGGAGQNAKKKNRRKKRKGTSHK